MKRVTSALALFLFVTGCSASFGNPSATLPASTPTILYLVTVPPGATPTTTPFQPVASTATLSPTPVFIVTPLPLDATFDPNALLPGTATPLPLEVIFDPNALPSGTATPLPLEPTATFDPNVLIPPTPTPQSFYVPPYAPDPALPLTANDTVTYLLLGSDKRPGQTYFRTDTIVIAVIRPASGQVALISVPRDLYVYIPIPNLGMMDRINTAYEYGEMPKYQYPGGGFALLKDTLFYNLGLRIDHLAIVDFDGFRRIVDTLGGIDVPVFCSYTDWHLIDPSYDPNNEDSWALYTVGPGVVHMDGDLALWYARSRQKSSDFDRGRRSQEVLRALYTRALQTDSISRIPQLYSDFNSSIITDLTLPDLLQLSPLALHLTNADIRSYFIGRDLVTGWMTPGGASVLLPNGPAIQSMLQQALAFPPRTTETEALTVEVRNGTVNPGWDSLAAERLNYVGYNTRLAVADRQDYANSLLYDLSANPDLSRITSMLNVLGLPPAAFVPAPMQTDINYRLIVGADYQPCFKPETLAP